MITTPQLAPWFRLQTSPACFALYNVKLVSEQPIFLVENMQGQNIFSFHSGLFLKNLNLIKFDGRTSFRSCIFVFTAKPYLTNGYASEFASKLHRVVIVEREAGFDLFKFDEFNVSLAASFPEVSQVKLSWTKKCINHIEENQDLVQRGKCQLQDGRPFISTSSSSGASCIHPSQMQFMLVT